ncbi:hypothetical protein J6590_008419 [Homalodisca vitripennis]|nr:hypothetical protein J6590_008419 [Homalodisca vitripennis]
MTRVSQDRRGELDNRYTEDAELLDTAVAAVVRLIVALHSSDFHLHPQSFDAKNLSSFWAKLPKSRLLETQLQGA